MRSGTSLHEVSRQRVFAGQQIRYQHHSSRLNCTMQFSVFLPPQADQQKVPVLYWLSGLTCTDENFSAKAGAQRVAALLGLALVIPDTSPRGEGVPDDPEGAYDLGLGAGFYVNATEQPWAANYQMYDYIVEELPDLLEATLPFSTQRAICGHSMGGHGALVIGLRNPQRYRSLSAFSPICNPMGCPWGEKALTAYLGQDRESWKQYDASQLLAATSTRMPILVDQGSADNFLEEQLRTDTLIRANQQSQANALIRYQAGYDHSYYFIATFIEEHLHFHYEALMVGQD